jgi:hydrogenase maturation protease
VTPTQDWRAQVVGIGNPERGDDGVGAEVARLVEARQLAGVQVTHHREPVELLEETLDADIVVVVDAVSSGATAGTVTVRDVHDDPLPDKAGTGGTHAVGLGPVIELARALGRLPRRLVIVGVEAGAVGTGNDLTTPVRASMEKAADAIAMLVQERR